MKTFRFWCLVMSALLWSGASVIAGVDVAGSKDPSLFTRMPGWFINQYEESEFGSFEFENKDGEKISIEGQKIVIAYAYDGAGKKNTSLQVMRNYQNAIKKVGGKIEVERGDFFCTMRLEKDGRETWVDFSSEIDAGWGGYTLTIVQKEAMKQQIVADAAAMNLGIKSDGHIAVYGINFDTNKSDIKSSAQPVIAEIAKLLKQEPTLKLHVVGHTDNVGNLDINIKLAHERAGAVMHELVTKHKIAAKRLSAYGVGPYCPVSTNTTDAGRAKNRRVELVQQ